MSIEHERPVHYRPGSWFGIFGDHATVLLPPTEKRRVAALWEVLDDGAGFGEVLDALIAGGLRDLPAFVLLSDIEGTTQLVLRGPASATVTAAGETVELDGARATTWIERSLTEVTTMTLELEEAAAFGATELITLGGLARVGRVRVGEEEGAGVAAVDPADDWDQEWDDAPPEEEPPVKPIEPIGPVEPVDEVGPTWEGQETEAFAAVGSERDPDSEPERDPEPELDPEPVHEDDDPVFGATVSGSYTDRSGAPPLSAAAPAGSYTDRQPAVPASRLTDVDSPTPEPRPVARLDFSHGETVDVDRPLIVGRAPEARRFSSSDQPRLITVPSPQQEISSTHLEIRPATDADHGAVVTDLGSTNGTVLVIPGRPPEELPPGRPVPLPPGAIVDLGDGLTITVAPA